MTGRGRRNDPPREIAAQSQLERRYVTDFEEDKPLQKLLKPQQYISLDGIRVEHGGRLGADWEEPLLPPSRDVPPSPPEGISVV